MAALLGVLFGLLISSYQASAQPPPVFEKIKEAQNRLDGLELKHQIITVREAVRKNRAVRYVRQKALMREVAVVGLNSKTGELKDFTFQETVLLDSKNRPHIKPPQLIAKDNTCELIWRGGSRWGFNRDLLLTCNGEELVIINLTMWTSRTERKVVTDQKTGKRICRQGPAELLISSYVPYSSDLHTPEVAEEGHRYLERTILQALQDLDDLNVTSKTFTEQNLSELASIEFIHALLVDEHMDPDEFRKAEKNGMLLRLVEKYWVEVAINQNAAFRMSVSPAGATGISQFICPTYARILDESPEAKLDPVFVRGMQDHVNAVKASITLFDSDMSSRWTPTVRKICSVSTEMLEDCWAASYNGGPNRLNRVIARRGQNWIEKETMIRNSRRYFASRLKEETYTYLAKLGNVLELLFTIEESVPSTTDP
ncbi:hypothetical protein [Candidatus Methylomirabilis sp.]|uniref:hypothetical protein n=1 Tax=Candidatus Methylomirabilis sp. TaxID=2032687 RepID=UPI002A60145F|nr:hypothetical protein [Candidatus Methylomirabilis sp.]